MRFSEFSLQSATIALCHYVSLLAMFSENLPLVVLWPSPSVPGKVPTDFPEACCTQVPRDWPGLSTPWTWPCCSACGAMFLVMPCDCQVVHQSKGRVPGTVFGSQWQRFPCRHSSTVCGLGMQQAELHSTKEDRTGCLLPPWPTDSHFLKRKETRSYPTFSR